MIRNLLVLLLVQAQFISHAVNGVDDGLARDFVGEFFAEVFDVGVDGSSVALEVVSLGEADEAEDFAGGIGSIPGTIIGALIIGVLNNTLDLTNVSAYWQQIIKGAIIVGAVILDQQKNKGGK